jgi:hypothetical protein
MVALMDEAHTTHELVEITGLHLFTVRQYVLALHKEGGCFIDHWNKNTIGRYTTPAYMIGHAKDAKKPAVSRSESNRRYNAKRHQQNVLFALAAVPLAA